MSGGVGGGVVYDDDFGVSGFVAKGVEFLKRGQYGVAAVVGGDDDGQGFVDGWCPQKLANGRFGLCLGYRRDDWIGLMRVGRRIALLGGSFDPVHHGHLIIARAVAEALDIDRVLLLPAGTAPHKPGGAEAPAADRAAMLRLAVGGDELFSVDTFDMDRDGPCYTVETVAHFHRQIEAGDELFWIIGADSLLELHEWYEPNRIAQTCRIVTAARSGFDPGELDHLRGVIDVDALAQIKRDVIATPRVDISATQIRQRVAVGQSIRYLTPLAVVDYITTGNLYRNSSK